MQELIKFNSMGIKAKGGMDYYGTACSLVYLIEYLFSFCACDLIYSVIFVISFNLDYNKLRFCESVKSPSLHFIR